MQLFIPVYHNNSTERYEEYVSRLAFKSIKELKYYLIKVGYIPAGEDIFGNATHVNNKEALTHVKVYRVYVMQSVLE